MFEDDKSLIDSWFARERKNLISNEKRVVLINKKIILLEKKTRTVKNEPMNSTSVDGQY